MSGSEQKQTANLPEPHKVGYGRPPEEHRFRKGQSGNPLGRPKGAKNKVSNVDVSHGMKPAEEFLRLEAYRPVTLREGDQIIQLPAIHAVFRAMGVSAMKGNRFAQRTMAEMVTRMEEDDKQARFELFGNALDYKERWDREIERCEAAGLPTPEPVPHPDDIILDPKNGGVRIAGPQTKEQKAHYDKAIARRQEAQEEVSYFSKKYRNAKDPAKKARWLEDWHGEQRMFDIINDSIAERYKIRLEDRSYKSGALRQGETLKKFAEDLKKPLGEREWGNYGGG